jgi:hypothetical protein
MTHLVSLADALGPIRDVYAHLLTPAAAWRDGARAKRAHQTDLDHFALICVAADRGFARTVTPTRWTRTAVYDVLRCAIPNWCSLHRCLWPVELPEVMWDWFDFLAETGRLDAASDPLAELRKPLQCYGGLDGQGRPRPDGAPREIPCECFLPYRETAELLNRLGMQCEQRGRYFLDVLRAFVGDDVDGSLDDDSPC